MFKSYKFFASNLLFLTGTFHRSPWASAIPKSLFKRRLCLCPWHRLGYVGHHLLQGQPLTGSCCVYKFCFLFLFLSFNFLYTDNAWMFHDIWILRWFFFAWKLLFSIYIDKMLYNSCMFLIRCHRVMWYRVNVCDCMSSWPLYGGWHPRMGIQGKVFNIPECSLILQANESNDRYKYSSFISCPHILIKPITYA